MFISEAGVEQSCEAVNPLIKEAPLRSLIEVEALFLLQCRFKPANRVEKMENTRNVGFSR